MQFVLHLAYVLKIEHPEVFCIQSCVVPTVIQIPPAHVTQNYGENQKII